MLGLSLRTEHYMYLFLCIALSFNVTYMYYLCLLGLVTCMSGTYVYSFAELIYMYCLSLTFYGICFWF